MIILALESSSAVASVAVSNDETLLYECSVNHGKTHSQTLMPMVEEALKILDLSINQIDLFALTSGPGSFTGIRIGISTVKGLGFALNKPCMGISTLEALAANLPFSDRLVYPIMDARAGQVYNGVYSLADVPLEIIPPRAIEIEKIISEIKESGKPALFLGDGVFVHKDTLLNDLGGLCSFAPFQTANQRAASTAFLAYKKYDTQKDYSAELLLPFYLRKSQAERMREEKLK